MTYLDAAPFPHAVFDGLFPDNLLDAVEAEFPPASDIRWGTFANQRERKQQGGPHLWGRYTTQLMTKLTSPEFCEALVGITEIPDLRGDTIGGGMHQISAGGLLAVHADFNRHPDTQWYRRVNLLLFLNRDWNPAWGGALELWDADGPVRVIEPEFNRMVVFNTSSTSWHGHPAPLTCPEGRYRRSVAAYYYSSQAPPDYEHEHSTVFMEAA